jgi:periplasmic divalent cation tolerance protein
MKTRKLMIALTTVADADAAKTLAHALVGEGLAACVNRLPIESTYRWQGRVLSEGETLCVIKSTSDLLDRLRERVFALHAYDVPEFVVLEPTAVASAYLAWALESCVPGS